jgi:Ras-related protein Rab-5C
MSELKCKVIVIGDSAVGKTTFISRLIDRFEENAASTFGVSYVTKEIKIDDNLVHFDIWDTAGQEKYHSVNRLFYLESKICIIVYDITNRTSFDNACNFWYKEITNEINDSIIIGLAGNKSDLYSMEEVKEEEAINYAKEKNIIFSLTSSYDNTGVNELFYQLAQKYLYSYHKGIIKKEVKDTNRIILNNDISINENKDNKNIINKKCC